MATLGLSVAGAAIGNFFFPGATFLGVSAAGWGWAIGGIVGNALFSEERAIEGRRLQEIRIPRSRYGADIPTVWGTHRVGGNIIWASELKEHKHEEEVGGGGLFKGGGGGATKTTYTYTVDFAVLLCEGEAVGVRKLWGDAKVLRESASTSKAEFIIASEEEELWDDLRIYLGSETQTPDELIEAYEGVGNVSAHRGYVYLVFQDFELSQFGNRIPAISAEVIMEGSQTCGNSNDTVDAGPTTITDTNPHWVWARNGIVDFWPLQKNFVGPDYSGSTLNPSISGERLTFNGKHMRNLLATIDLTKNDLIVDVIYVGTPARFSDLIIPVQVPETASLLPPLWAALAIVAGGEGDGQWEQTREVVYPLYRADGVTPINTNDSSGAAYVNRPMYYSSFSSLYSVLSNGFTESFGVGTVIARFPVNNGIPEDTVAAEQTTLSDIRDIFLVEGAITYSGIEPTEGEGASPGGATEAPSGVEIFELPTDKRVGVELAAGEIHAYHFVIGPGGEGSIAYGTNVFSNAAKDVSISQTPGDFSVLTYPCGQSGQTEGGLGFSDDPQLDRNGDPAQCQLEPGVDYYYNIKNTDSNADSGYDLSISAVWGDTSATSTTSTTSTQVATQESLFQSLHTLQTQHDNVTTGEIVTYDNFRDRYNINDSFSQCIMGINPGDCSNPNSNTDPTLTHEIDGYGQDQFRVFLPPGTEDLLLTLPGRPDGGLVVAVSAGRMPIATPSNYTVDSVPEAERGPKLLDDREELVLQQDSSGSLRISIRQYQGGNAFTKLSTGVWLYIRVLANNYNDLYRVHYENQCDVNDYTTWYNTDPFTVDGHVDVGSASGGDDDSSQTESVYRYTGRAGLYVLYGSGTRTVANIAKLDPETLEILKTYSIPSSFNSKINSSQAGFMIKDDYVAIGEKGDTGWAIGKFNDDTNQIDLTCDGQAGSLSTGDYIDPIPHSNAVLQVGEELINPIALDADPVSLQTIVNDVCNSCGVDDSDLDLSALTDYVIGYVRPTQQSGREIIEPLQPVHQFDLIESDWKIKAINRGGSVDHTISEDDLAAHQEGDSLPDDIVVTRANELELPNSITFKYIENDGTYQQSAQKVQRHVTEALSESSFGTEEVLGPTDAIQAAEIALWNRWLERESHYITLPMKYADMDAGDILSVPANNRTYRMRVTRIGMGGGVLAVEAVADEATTYTPNRTGDPVNFPVPTPTLKGPTVAYALDIPILRDEDDNAGYYLAGTGIFEAWSGFEWYVSLDGGQSFNPVVVIGQGATIGTTTNTLADGPTTVKDEGSSVNVSLFSGTLNSTSELGMLNHTNVLLIGDEVVSFQSAQQENDGTYTLTGFLRGLRGTEWAMDQHSAGERVILASPRTWRRIRMDVSDLDIQRYYKAVTIGNPLDAASLYTFTNTGIGLKPFAPAHLAASDNGNGTFDVTWIRRTRVGGEWKDKVDAKLGEDSESYKVIVEDSGGSQKSSSTVSSESATVSAVSTDVIKVAQISADVGDGYFASITV